MHELSLLYFKPMRQTETESKVITTFSILPAMSTFPLPSYKFKNTKYNELYTPLAIHSLIRKIALVRKSWSAFVPLSHDNYNAYL